MSALTNIILGVGGIVHSLINLYIWVVIFAAIFTWIPPFSSNSMVQALIRLKRSVFPFLLRITEPAYVLIQRTIPTNFNGIDMAPLILIIGLQLLDIIMISMLNALATSF